MNPVTERLESFNRFLNVESLQGNIEEIAGWVCDLAIKESFRFIQNTDGSYSVVHTEESEMDELFMELNPDISEFEELVYNEG